MSYIYLDETLPAVLEANIRMTFLEAWSSAPLVFEMNPSDRFLFFFFSVAGSQRHSAKQNCAGFSFLCRNNVKSVSVERERVGSSLISTQ